MNSVRRLVMACVLVACVGGAWSVVLAREVSSVPKVPKAAKLSEAMTDARVELIGSARIESNATDLSGLTEPCGPVPHNRFGAWGSAISGAGVWGEGMYVLVPDRGPKDGAEEYSCRFHEAKITVEPESTPPVKIEVLKTTLLNDGKFQYVGLSSSFDSDDHTESLRLDPEGARVLPSGNLLICDEYGPVVYEFTREGKRVRSYVLPSAFGLARPMIKAVDEDRSNARGRVANRGFEGLALSPDGKRAFALLQSPLIQDGGREGVNIRLMEIALASGDTREFVYVLDEDKLGTNEILAISDTRFLVIERDGRDGSKARSKTITMIDIAGATDVSGVEALPKHELPATIVPVKKSLLIDMLDPRFGIAGSTFPEKIEGLALGPVLKDGRVTLLVANDNDFRDDVPTMVWCFAMPREVMEGKK
jgi:hypothetical protein